MSSCLPNVARAKRVTHTSERPACAPVSGVEGRAMISVPNAVGYAAAAFTTLSFVPQVWRVVRTRDTHAISASAYVVFCVGTLLWFAYGVVVASAPIEIANGVTFLLAATVLAYKVRSR